MKRAELKEGMAVRVADRPQAPELSNPRTRITLTVSELETLVREAIAWPE